MREDSALAQTVVAALSAAIATDSRTLANCISTEAIDEIVDPPTGLGHRLAQRLMTSSRATQLREAMIELIAEPADESAADLLRAQIRRALAADSDLGPDITKLLWAAGVAPGKYTVTITSAQGIQVGDGNIQTNTFGTPPGQN